MQDLVSLQAHAKLIPTDNLIDDLSCLSALYQKSNIYFDFCFSRFQLLSSNPQTIQTISQICQNDTNPDHYLPLLDLILTHLSPKDSSDFVFPLIFTTKGKNIASLLFTHKNYIQIAPHLLEMLFSCIPEIMIIPIRDELLFRYISIGGSSDIMIKSLKCIPVTLNLYFYNEFLLIAAIIVQSKASSKEFVDVAIDAILACQEPYSLTQVLLSSNIQFPTIFKHFTKEFDVDENRFIDIKLEELPSLLRIHLLQPSPSEMNCQRFCRTIESEGGLIDEYYKRLSSETDPKLLHDLLIANPQLVNISSNVPFRFTLFALVALHDPNMVTYFLSEFSDLSEKSDLNVLKAATEGLSLISTRNPRVVSTVFPLIRKLMVSCSKTIQIPLLNAIASAVASDLLDSEFIWRDYHSIRTIPDDGLEYEDLIHYCLIGLHDKDDAEIAQQILLQIAKHDRFTVISGLWRIPTPILERHPQLRALLPSIVPCVSLKTDMLPQYVQNELSSKLDTFKLLQLSTAFTMFFDVFTSMKEEWIVILVQAGKSVYTFSIEDKYYNKLLNIAEDSKDPKVRFACCFSFSLFLAHRLIDPFSIVNKLHKIASEDDDKCTRMMALYGLSHCNINSPDKFVKTIILRAKANNSIEDLVGIGYCINSWYSSMMPFLEIANEQYSKIPVVWASIATANKFLGRKYSINESDRLGFAQYIFYQNKDENIEEMIRKLLGHDLDPALALTALCGFIPNLAFRVPEFSADERQRTITGMMHGDEYNLVNELLSRQRLCHKESATEGTIGKTIIPAVSKLKNEWKTLSSDETAMLISSLSEAQLNDIMKDEQEDYALFCAISARIPSEIARLLVAKERSQEMMERIKNAYPNELSTLVSEMLHWTKTISPIANLLVFYRFDEHLGNDSNLSMAPSLLANLDPMTMTIVERINNIDSKFAQEFVHCLLLKNPKFFEINTEAFEIFQ